VRFSISSPDRRVGYILALNVVLHFGDLLPTHAPIGPLFFAAVWLVVIMPISSSARCSTRAEAGRSREMVAKTADAACHQPSTTSILTVSPTLNWSSKPDPTGRRSSLPSFSTSRVRHQAGVLSRPDDDRRFMSPRRRAVSEALPSSDEKRARRATWVVWPTTRPTRRRFAVEAETAELLIDTAAQVRV
jgi:hypothetical protein